MARHTKQPKLEVIKHDGRERPRPFDPPAPPVPVRPRAPSLMTCPNCATSNYCEFRDDLGRLEAYCQYCSWEVAKKPMGD